MRVTDLTHDELLRVAEAYPEWLAYHHPEFMCKFYPGYMESNHPEVMCLHQLML